MKFVRVLPLVLTVAFIAVLFGVRSVIASNPNQPLDLANATNGYQHTAWIEQQDDWPMPADPITNPLPTCTWSVNDHNDWIATGHLDPGASTSRDQCVVSDFNPVYACRNGICATWSNAFYGFAGLRLLSPSPDLTISVCYQPQGRCFPLGAVYDSVERAWWYTFCGRANYGPNDPALADIVGSNGGRGVITTVTMSVANPTNRRVRNLWATGGIGSDIFYPSACERDAFGVPILTDNEYPFRWSAS